MRFEIHRITTEQLGQLGVSQIAYVKPVVVNGTLAFAIHSADGTPIGVTADRETALAAIVQNEMHPSLVH
jgi:hypothetical protein